jgi:hypothetical protein
MIFVLPEILQQVPELQLKIFPAVLPGYLRARANMD